MTQSVKRGSVDRLLTLFALTVLLVASSVPAAVHGDDDSLFAGRKPLVAQRVGMVTASTHLGEVYRPDLFDRTIQALPSLGLNGVLLIVSTAHGTSAGRDLLPQILDDDEKIKAWSQMFDRIKALGLNVYVSFSPLIPPEFTREQLKAHYAGRQKLNELPDAIRAATETQANAVFTTFAQVDGLMLHSLELEPVWGPAVSPYPARDVPAAEQALGAYLDGLEAACRRHKKQTWFWAHVWGVTPSEIRSIRRVLSEHPDVVTLEDHYWPNVGWPTLPFLGYLPPDLRDTLRAPRRFGIFLDTTDGEYFGAGRTLSGYPDPHWNAAIQSADRGAEVVLIRFNAQDLTAQGTLFGLNGIMPVAAARALWSPRPSLDEVWRSWATDRYGPHAAPHVVEALRQTATVITKGFCYRGMPLLDHSTITPYRWRPATSGGGARTPLIGPPSGRKMYHSDYGSVPKSEYVSWQIRPTTGSIEEFESHQAQAREAVERAITALRAAEPHLSKTDRDHLYNACVNTQWMLRSVRQVGRLAHAANVVTATNQADASQLADWSKQIESLHQLAAPIEHEFGDDYLTTHKFITAVVDGRRHSAPSLPTCLRAIAQMHQRRLDDIRAASRKDPDHPERNDGS